MAFEIEIIVVRHPVGTLRNKYSERGPLNRQVVPGDKRANEVARFAGGIVVDGALVSITNGIDVSLVTYGESFR